tara:strand:- start:2565 stop:2834 length:270 start_codon:yes stop_codon:yes gene_type:complete
MQKIKKYPVKYHGNIFWLIVILILFLPVGILLLASGIRPQINNEYYGLKYKGNLGWLIFWTIIFFPIAIILAFIKGVDIIVYQDFNNIA